MADLQIESLQAPWRVRTRGSLSAEMISCEAITRTTGCMVLAFKAIVGWAKRRRPWAGMHDSRAAHQCNMLDVVWGACLQHEQLTSGRAATGAPHGSQVQLGDPLRPCRPLLAAPRLSLTGLRQNSSASKHSSSNRPHWSHRAAEMHAGCIAGCYTFAARI